MNNNDKERLSAFYQKAHQEYGDNDARSVQWTNEGSQEMRFMVLKQIANLQGKSILDVGCGLGDLYHYLLQNKIEAAYTGVDIFPDFINSAKQKFPDATFMCKDIFDVSEQYDYVLASGSLNFKVADNEKYYFSMIEKMYSLARKGLGFNMLNRECHIDNETYAAYDPRAVGNYCKTLCQHVEIMLDYLPQDFTVYMYRT